MEPSRQILWNVGSSSFLWIAGVVTVLSLVVGFALRTAAWRRGRKGLPKDRRRSRLLALLRLVMMQEKGIVRGHRYVMMHRCVFYGMLLLFLGSLLIGLEMHFGLNFLRGTTYVVFSLILDLAGLAVLVGVCLAAYQRYIVKPDRLESNPGDAFFLAMLAAVALSGFLLKGMRLFAASGDGWAFWSPVGGVVAALAAKMSATEGARHFHRLVWYGHATLAFALIALIPWTKFLHIFVVPLSHYLSLPWAERASLPQPPDDGQSAKGILADCTRKQLIEADACIECGRCKRRCPIYQAELSFAPMTLMKNMKRLLHRGKLSSPLMDVIDESALWACTGCRSCEERCPANGAHASAIVDIRRSCTAVGQASTAAAARYAENEARLALPGDRSAVPRDRDVYIWPGCHAEKTGSNGVVQRLADILKRAGLSAAVLAPPACCGGPVRRLGNEPLFLKMAMANIHYLNAIREKTIVTHCPHCFNTLKNEYPGLGGEFHVMHHSRHLAGLLSEGRLKTAKDLSLKVVFHDPCFLGRYNQEFSSPRKLIAAVDGLAFREIKHNRMKSICCGSGGGIAPPEIALSNSRNRVREAVKAGAEAIVACCPYCEENLAAAARSEYPEKPPGVMDVVAVFGEGEDV